MKTTEKIDVSHREHASGFMDFNTGFQQTVRSPIRVLRCAAKSTASAGRKIRRRPIVANSPFEPIQFAYFAFAFQIDDPPFRFFLFRLFPPGFLVLGFPSPPSRLPSMPPGVWKWNPDAMSAESIIAKVGCDGLLKKIELDD